ncbi:MAG: tetratricopeptide repeat protein, partial [Nitrospinota bacterium]
MPGAATAAEALECPKAAEKFLEAGKAAAEPRVRESLIRKAIKTCPDEPRAYYLLGRHYQALYMRSYAREAYRHALERLPMASQIIQDVGKLNPRDPRSEIWNVVGFLIPPAERGGSGPPEEMSLQGLMAKEPQDPEARLALAQELTGIGVNLIQNSQPGGLDLLKRAIELVPTYERARTFLVQNYFGAGEYNFNGEWFEKAVSQYKKALFYAPNDPRLHLRIAEAYRR